MDFNKLKKEDLVVEAAQLEQELLALKEQTKDYNELKKQNGIFIKGSNEKDDVIRELKQQALLANSNQEQLFKNIETQTNQSIAAAKQQTAAIAVEYEFVKGGLVDFITTSDNLLALVELQTKVIKDAVNIIKNNYKQED